MGAATRRSAWRFPCTSPRRLGMPPAELRLERGLPAAIGREMGLRPQMRLHSQRGLKAAGIDYACVTSSGIPVSNPTVANPDLEQPCTGCGRSPRKRNHDKGRGPHYRRAAGKRHHRKRQGRSGCSRSGIPRRSTMGLAQRLRSWRDPSLSFPVRLGSPVRVERLAATQGLNPAALQSG